MDEDRRLRIAEYLSWKGLCVAGLGMLSYQLGRALDNETRYLKSAVHANDLAELQALLAAGAVTLPCLVGIKHSLASTTKPFPSRLGKKPSVMAMTTKYIETFDPRPDRNYRSGRENVAQFLEVAQHWNVTDGHKHSLAVSRDVQCTNAPFVHAAYDRKAIQPSLLRALVMDVFNFVLQRKTPIAHVVHEQHIPPLEAVAIVGELRSTPKTPYLKPYSNGSIVPLKNPAGQRGGAFGECLALMPPSSRRRGRARSVLVTRDLDELTMGMSSMSAVCHVVGRVLLGLGLTMVGRKAWKQIRRWRRVKAEMREERQRMLLGALAQDDDRRDLGECAVCMQRPCNSAFPCGHVVACFACALQCDRCPMCRRGGQPIRLYPAAAAADGDA
eukprot:jgi/Ulvmu1/824/UM010_0198.1